MQLSLFNAPWQHLQSRQETDARRIQRYLNSQSMSLITTKFESWTLISPKNTSGKVGHFYCSFIYIKMCV